MVKERFHKTPRRPQRANRTIYIKAINSSSPGIRVHEEPQNDPAAKVTDFPLQECGPHCFQVTQHKKIIYSFPQAMETAGIKKNLFLVLQAGGDGTRPENDCRTDPSTGEPRRRMHPSSSLIPAAMPSPTRNVKYERERVMKKTNMLCYARHSKWNHRDTYKHIWQLNNYIETTFLPLFFPIV